MSHFMTLANIENLGTESEMDTLLSEKLEAIAQFKKDADQDPNDFVSAFMFKMLAQDLSTGFELKIKSIIHQLMAPYFDDTTDPQYLEFVVAENEDGAEYNKLNQSYGYYHNPNAQYNYYRIKGCWLLVKESIQEVMIGERNWDLGDPYREAPVGYKWVAAAKKADVEWELMKSVEVKNAYKHFPRLEKWFQTGKAPKDIHGYGEITESGIVYGHELIYKKGEKLEEYLLRLGLGGPSHYPILAHAFLKSGKWTSPNDKNDETRRKIIKDVLDEIYDNDILVAIDCYT